MGVGFSAAPMSLVRDDVEAPSGLLFEPRAANTVQGANVCNVVALDVLGMPVPLDLVTIGVTSFSTGVRCVLRLQHARAVHLVGGDVIKARLTDLVTRRDVGFSAEDNLHVVSVIRHFRTLFISRVSVLLQHRVKAILDIPLLARLEEVQSVVPLRSLLVSLVVAVRDYVEVLDAMRWNKP